MLRPAFGEAGSAWLDRGGRVDESAALNTLVSDLSAHAGTIQITMFVLTVVFLAMASIMAGRLFSVLDETRLLFWRSSQHLEAARTLARATGPSTAAQRLEDHRNRRRRKLTTAGGKTDLFS